MIAAAFVVVRLLAHGRIRKNGCVGLRLPMADLANAGYGGRLRSTDPSYVRHVFPHGAASALGSRQRAAIQGLHRRPALAGIYLPIARGVQSLANAIGGLQGGRLAIYLLYSFLTLLGLLVFVL